MSETKCIWVVSSAANMLVTGNLPSLHELPIPKTTFYVLVDRIW